MSKKVMIADDDAAIVDFLSILLQLEGYDITSTLNGATLLEMDDDLPDLIILDIWMSGVDGRDVCKQLKQQEHTRNIPILMVSASTNIQDSAMSAGAMLAT